MLPRPERYPRSLPQEPGFYASAEEKQPGTRKGRRHWKDGEKKRKKGRDGHGDVATDTENAKQVKARV